MTDENGTTEAPGLATPKRTPVPSPRATADAVVGMWTDFGDPLEPLSDFPRATLEEIVRALMRVVENHEHDLAGQGRELCDLYELKKEVGRYRRQPVPPEPPDPPRGRRIQL